MGEQAEQAVRLSSEKANKLYIYIYIYIYMWPSEGRVIHQNVLLQSYIWLIVLCKILLFSDVLFFESPYGSMFARAVLFNWEIAGSIRLRSFIRAKRAE